MMRLVKYYMNIFYHYRRQWVPETLMRCLYVLASNCFVSELSVSNFGGAKYISQCISLGFSQYYYQLFHSRELATFVAVHALLMGFYVQTGAVLSRTFNIMTTETATKLFLYTNTVVIILLRFSFNEIQILDLDEYILIYMVMCVKALCAAVSVDAMSDEDYIRDDFPPIWFHVTNYAGYSGWPTYEEYRNYKYEHADRRWFKMVFSCIVTALFFRLISEASIYLTKFDSMANIVYNIMVRSMQYRCKKYYYFAQVAELEVVAYGYKKGSQLDYYRISNPPRAELTISIIDFAYWANMPGIGFLKRKIIEWNNQDPLFATKHIQCIALLLILYSDFNCLILACFLTLIFVQAILVKKLSRWSNVCLLECEEDVCPYKYPHNSVPSVFIKLYMIFTNQFRLALFYPVFAGDYHYQVLVLLTMTLSHDFLLYFYASYRCKVLEKEQQEKQQIEEQQQRRPIEQESMKPVEEQRKAQGLSKRQRKARRRN